MATDEFRLLRNVVEGQVHNRLQGRGGGRPAQRNHQAKEQSERWCA